VNQSRPNGQSRRKSKEASSRMQHHAFQWGWISCAAIRHFGLVILKHLNRLSSAESVKKMQTPIKVCPVVQEGKTSRSRLP
jgi:hypothetical protein